MNTNTDININLTRMKNQIRENFCDEILYKTPVYLTPELWNTDLYKFCQNLNKGADLHVHGGAMIPITDLIDFLYKRDDVLICVNGPKKSYLDLVSNNPDDNYILFSKAIDSGKINIDELDKLWTLKGCNPNQDIWDWFETLFEKHTCINEPGSVCRDYFVRAFEYYCEQNIFHVELRLFLFGTPEYASTKVHDVFDSYLKVKEKYPLLHSKIIPIGLKHPKFGLEATKTIFQNTVNLYNEFFDDGQPYFTGIDLVNEEDSGISITEFIDLLSSTKEKLPDIEYYLHAGESCSKDNNHIKVALDLGSKRIGHGLNLWMHPHLIPEIIENDICLEVCPISNLTLGYAKDLREHPAKEYFRKGVPIALSSDDPTYQEHSTLTDDYFSTILAWDLNWEDIDKLRRNSIKYSSLNNSQKEKLLTNL